MSLDNPTTLQFPSEQASHSEIREQRQRDSFELANFNTHCEGDIEAGHSVDHERARTTTRFPSYTTDTHARAETHTRSGAIIA